MGKSTPILASRQGQPQVRKEGNQEPLRAPWFGAGLFQDGFVTEVGMSTAVDLVSRVARSVAAHIQSHGGYYPGWYCGIAADAKDRLVNGHGATTASNDALYWDCGSDTVARAIESHLHDLGCKGSHGGGDSTTRYVYVYRISRSTRE